LSRLGYYQVLIREGVDIMDSFPRPTEERLYEKKEKVNRVCPECGSHDVAAYRVLSDAGWWEVVKCQNCLYSLERKRSENQYAPCQLLWRLM
jgi:hypothetical protein